jgi:hypothetical protein
MQFRRAGVEQGDCLGFRRTVPKRGWDVWFPVVQRLGSSHRAEAPGFRLPGIQRSCLTGVAGGKRGEAARNRSDHEDRPYLQGDVHDLAARGQGLVIADDMVSS